jgi:cbb3-type cytochrome oxidase maturation protein
MSVIILLIIFSLILAIGFLVAFIWSVRSNQLEDDYTPSVRILFENELIEKKDKQEHTNKDL